MAVFPDLGVCRTKGTERQELPIHQTFLIFVIALGLFKQSEALWSQQELSRSLGTEPPIADSCYIIAKGSASPVPRAGPRYPLERRRGDLSPVHGNRTLELSRAPWRRQDGFCLQVPERESEGRYFNSWAELTTLLRSVWFTGEVIPKSISELTCCVGYQGTNQFNLE